MLVRLIIDPDVCIGSGECVAEEPDAVELDRHGIAVVTAPELEEERARTLCDNCPVGAISCAA